MATARPTRAERRRDSESRILAAARASFTERGYERTTIRAVAAAAGVDPALVIQYFGSKQALFDRAVQVGADRLAADRPRELTELLLDQLGAKLGGLPETSLATLRSMLTHPEAAEAARASLGRQVDEISAGIPTADARLRAALITMVTVGVVIGRELLDVADLRGADPEQIAEMLRPALRALVDGGGPAGR